MLQRYAAVPAYITKDGSEIRELMHPSVHGNGAQSLAEATVAAGESTLHHRHARTEEIYHVTAGRGTMYLGDESFEVGPGDTVCIAPGTPHSICALEGPLKILCACSPAYAHDDTELCDRPGENRAVPHDG